MKPFIPSCIQKINFVGFVESSSAYVRVRLRRFLLAASLLFRLQLGIIYALYFFFAVLMMVSLAVAFKANDGVVESNYYEKAAGYFRAKEAEMPSCDVAKGYCLKSVHGMNVEFGIVPMPVEPMKEKTFRVRLLGRNNSVAYKPGEGVASGFIMLDLSMPGMVMAPNRVKLLPEKDGWYEGRGTIVRCPGGGTRWKATLSIPETSEARNEASGKNASNEAHVEVEYVFDVAKPSHR